MSKEFYTIDKVAEILGMHHKTIRKFISEGQLKAVKVGKQWRISGHDLSVFMERDERLEAETHPLEGDQEISELDVSVNDGEGLAFTTKINVSSVIDINEVDKDSYFRISNTLIALQNGKDPEMGKSTVHVKYDEKHRRLKILLWGSVRFMEEMLSTISILTE